MSNRRLKQSELRKVLKIFFNQPLKVDFLFTSWKKGGF
ncbi:hypothetical protein [Staphylococcus phage phiSa2wa-st30.2]|nr:hypothetical protein [Staphylococcus phage phiSa2wa-st30.2]